MKHFLPALKEINNQIDFSEVVNWFNQNNIDYFGMNDLEMIIQYIETELIHNNG